MKQTVAVVLACVALCGCHAQPTGPKMHRVQAGTPDQSGWMTADSTLGRFSVRVPVPFNDFTIETPEPSSLTRKVEVVGCKSSEGIKFSASRISYKTPGTSAELFEKMKSGSGFPNATVAPAKAGAHEAVDIAFGDSSTRANQRAVLVGEEIYVLIVEWPVQQKALAASFVPTFFDSLKIPE